MKIKWMLGMGAGAAALLAAGEYALARYFLRRTLMRGKADNKRTQKMAGTDWSVYLTFMEENRQWFLSQPHEDVYIQSEDGLKLHGTYFPGKDPKRAVICFHGYTSRGLNDYPSLARFYMGCGLGVLTVDERAHGDSEGTYIGFGCLDRLDAKKWMEYMAGRLGEDCELLLQGISMGAATVDMAVGLELPPQVKGAVSDCAFTSAKEVFTSVLKTTYHMPAFPLMDLSDRMAKKEAGYGLDECNTRDEVKKAKIPMLFIHGSKDTFVPCSMVHELYEACAAPKDLLIIEGASHAEAYYKDRPAYEAAVRKLMERAFTKGVCEE